MTRRSFLKFFGAAIALTAVATHIPLPSGELVEVPMTVLSTRTMQDMLNEYFPAEIIREEMMKRDYLLSKIDRDDTWKGGAMVVPFQVRGS